MAYKRQLEYDNAIAHLQGAYFVDALLATVGNMFSGKTSKKNNYPDKPYNLNLDKDDNNKEKEKERQLELFAARFDAHMRNFQRSKEKGQS